MFCIRPDRDRPSVSASNYGGRTNFVSFNYRRTVLEPHKIMRPSIHPPTQPAEFITRRADSLMNVLFDGKPPNNIDDDNANDKQYDFESGSFVYRRKGCQYQ